MKPRLDAPAVAADTYAAMLALEGQVRRSGIDPTLLHLVKIRASQINGCAFCIDMHTREARAEGETEQRLYLLDAWAESPCYTDRERAALAWTEAVTRVADTHVPDDVYAMARAQFDEKALVELTLAVIAINGRNRLSIAFRAVPGMRVERSSAGAAAGSAARQSTSGAGV
jgi:AhpD family alkylhydroperoxidase